MPARTAERIRARVKRVIIGGEIILLILVNAIKKIVI
jgi:hypothetical protein